MNPRTSTLGWSLISKKDKHFDISSLQLVVIKLKWFTFFIAIYQDEAPAYIHVGQKGAIFSHILRQYKKGQARTK